MRHIEICMQIMEQQIRMLEQRARIAESQLKDLQSQLAQMKPLNIENITYKIQELTVSELSGTLNVGLTALSDPQQLEQWLNKEQQMTAQKGQAGVQLENLQSASDKEQNECKHYQNNIQTLHNDDGQNLQTDGQRED